MAITKTIFFHVGHLQNKDVSKYKLVLDNTKLIMEKLENQDEVHISVSPKLKSRVFLYNALNKNLNVKVHTVFYPQSFQDFLVSFSSSIEYAQKEFSKLQAPIIGIDTDEISLAKGYEVDLVEETAKYLEENLDLDNHDTPYHKEPISQHILMTIENSEKDSLVPIHLKHLLETTAAFHDLGKYWTKSFDEAVGHSRYFGHENVSSVIFLSYAIQDKEYFGLFPEDISSITKLILTHMVIKNGELSKKLVSRLKLSDEELFLLNIFNEIDKKSKII